MEVMFGSFDYLFATLQNFLPIATLTAEDNGAAPSFWVLK